MSKELERRAVLRAPVLAGATHTELVARLAVMGDARSMAGVGASAKACAVEMRARLSPHNDTAPIAMFSSRHKMGFFYFELALLKTLLEVRFCRPRSQPQHMRFYAHALSHRQVPGSSQPNRRATRCLGEIWVSDCM